MTHARTPAEMAPHAAVLAAELAPLHVADIVEVLNEQTPETVTRVFAHLPFEVAVELLDQPELEASDELLKSLPVEQALALLSAMSDDRAADLFRHVEEPVRSQLLTRLDPAARNSLQQLLAYPPDTAGSLMTTEFVSVPANWTVERTLQHIRDVERTRETVYAIYILEPDTGRLLRALSLRQLISGRPETSILSIARSI
jgi:magnesium transporter